MTSKYKLLIYFYNNINLIFKIKDLNLSSGENHNMLECNKNEEITEAIIQNNNNTLKIDSIYYCKILKYQVNLNSYFVDLGNNNYGLLKYNKRAASILKNPTIGQKLLVTLTKEGSENKYPVVSPNIVLHGLYSNFMPFDKNIIFDNKLEPLTQKNKIINEIIQNEGDLQFGLYIKNVCNIKNLVQEINIKKCLWKQLSTKINTPVGLIYSFSSILNMICSDPQNIPTTIIANSLSTIELIKNELNSTLPFLEVKFKYDSSDIDYLHCIDVLEEYLSNPIYINQDIVLHIYNTKALTFIDIDFKGNNNLKKEEALLKANLESIIPITKLIKFRNISGQIFIDILKVKNRTYKKIILQKYREAFQFYNLQATIIGFTKLTILEIEKPKKINSLENNYYNICYSCKGTGKLINFNLLNIKTIIEIQNILNKNPLAKITIKSSDKNIKLFKNINTEYIKQLNTNNLQFIIDNSLINCIITY